MSGLCSPKVLSVLKIAVTNHIAVITFSQKMGRGERNSKLGTKLKKKKHLFTVLHQPSLHYSVSIMKSPDLNFLNLDLKGSNL